MWGEKIYRLVLRIRISYKTSQRFNVVFVCKVGMVATGSKKCRVNTEPGGNVP
jgi:hypothetical protein